MFWGKGKEEVPPGGEMTAHQRVSVISPAHRDPEVIGQFYFIFKEQGPQVLAVALREKVAFFYLVMPVIGAPDKRMDFADFEGVEDFRVKGGSLSVLHVDSAAKVDIRIHSIEKSTKFKIRVLVFQPEVIHGTGKLGIPDLLAYKEIPVFGVGTATGQCDPAFFTEVIIQQGIKFVCSAGVIVPVPLIAPVPFARDSITYFFMGSGTEE
jgi:hypothetical protein